MAQAPSPISLCNALFRRWKAVSSLSLAAGPHAKSVTFMVAGRLHLGCMLYCNRRTKDRDEQNNSGACGTAGSLFHRLLRRCFSKIRPPAALGQHGCRRSAQPRARRAASLPHELSLEFREQDVATQNPTGEFLNSIYAGLRSSGRWELSASEGQACGDHQ